MKKLFKFITAFSLCMFFFFTGNSQVKGGVKVIYNEKNKVDESKFNHLNAETKASILEKINTIVKAELVHSGHLSTYTTKFEDSKLSSKNENGNNIDIKISVNQSATNFWYKDFQSNTFISPASIKDEKYLIKDSIATNWEILNEYEQIDSFKCQKAILRYAYGMKNIVAWFATEIPINDGPQFYAGLPGLILKVELEKKIFYATSVTFFTSVVEFPNKPSEGIVKTIEGFNNQIASTFSPDNNKTINTKLPNGTKTVTNISTTY